MVEVLKTTAALNGIPLLSSHKVSWGLTLGTVPYQTRVEVRPEDLDALLAKAGPSPENTLELFDGETTHTFKKILILGQAPARNPFTKGVLLADRRWLWQWIHVFRRFNMRRRSGELRRPAGFKQPLILDPIFDIAYHPYTTKDKQGLDPFSAKEALLDVLTAEDALNESSVSSQDVLDNLDQLPIENKPIDEKGNAAVDQILARIPGASVRLDNDGDLHLVNTIDESEVEIVGVGDPENPGAAGPEIIGGGHVERIDKRFIRPRKVIVYFTPEPEFRVDFFGDDPKDVGSITVDNPPRFAENVLPNPDFQLTLADGTKIPQGQWITFKQAIDAWNAELAKSPQGILKKITFEMINKAFLPGTGFWAALDLLGKSTITSQESNWAARISAIQQHYRQTYRISRLWNDRFFSIRDYLVATLDREGAQRSPALVYANHSFKPSKKALLLSSLQNGKKFYILNQRNSYPGKDTDPDKDNLPAPADLQVVDEDQGIIRIGYQLDRFGLLDAVFPAPIKAGTEAKASFRISDQFAASSAINMESLSGKLPELDPKQQAAFFFTVVPASPNSKRGLYPIEVSPGEVKDILPETLADGLENSIGPVMEIRMQAGVETARIAHNETSKPFINQLFGVPDELTDVRGSLKPFTINDGEQEAVGLRNVASLPSIAKAAAAVIYARFADRVEGNMTAKINSDVLPTGGLESVIHSVDQRGAVLTEYSLRKDTPTFDIFSFMPDSTREIILKQVQLKK